MSVGAKFQLPSLFRSGLKVPGGGVGWCGVVGRLRPILVSSLSLSQAEQLDVNSCWETFRIRAPKFYVIYNIIHNSLDLLDIITIMTL